MNKNNRFVKTGIAAVLATLLAGASTQMLLRALGLPCGAAGAYLPALAAAALCGVGSLGGAAAIVCGVAAVLAGGAAVGANLSGLDAVRAWAAGLASGTAAEGETLARACGMLSVILGVILGAGSFWLIHHRGGTPFALVIGAAILIGSYALSEDLSFGLAVPGLIAALAAFAFAGDVPRDAGGWRALVCAALAVGLALLLVPRDRLTWEPLERAAQTVRTVFEDYFQFTEERVPFTISTEGYDHAAEVDGSVVAQLGGPANPDPEPVMRVTADADVLLRGAIRRTYTGSSWTDNDAKARYLFYDFTRRHIRENVLGMRDNEAFALVRADVEFLSEGTSSVFVPTRLESFDMDAQNAVYYNSIGEMFLSREVQPGDRYALTGWQVGNEETLRAAVAAGQQEDDGEYDQIYAPCIQLPDGIEQGVYTLAAEITQACDNPYDKAKAIETWLKENCVYTLTPGYPDAGRDFVSQFVLTDREGYCSYFASAMAVMCRMAGLPARYVEGYYVRAGEEPVVVTGENAHAWTEVYFKGVGWVSFNPANGGNGGDGLGGDGMDDGDTAGDEPETPPVGSEPTPTPEPPENDGATPPPEGEPTVPPEDSATPTPNPDFFASPTPPPWQEEPSDHERDRTWLWILLAILAVLLLLALAALWVRRRLAASDPVRLCDQTEEPGQAAMILYRSILTLLNQTGQAPLSGETPGAFARRVAAQTPNPDFVVFADAVAMSAYARAEVSRATVDIGRRAYQTFEKGLKRGERLRFMLVRLTRGLGAFDTIP